MKKSGGGVSDRCIDVAISTGIVATVFVLIKLFKD